MLLCLNVIKLYFAVYFIQSTHSVFIHWVEASFSWSLITEYSSDFCLSLHI